MEITTQEFKEKLKRGDKFLVDFYGQWCGPCKAMKPMYESASKLLTESKYCLIILSTLSIAIPPS